VSGTLPTGGEVISAEASVTLKNSGECPRCWSLLYTNFGNIANSSTPCVVHAQMEVDLGAGYVLVSGPQIERVPGGSFQSHSEHRNGNICLAPGETKIVKYRSKIKVVSGTFTPAATSETRTQILGVGYIP
jgi:hypothetical protein